MIENTLLTVSTINLNGIRAAHKRGLTEWIDASRPDVLLLQEVRAPEEVTEALLGNSWQIFSYPCEIKGRAGVTIALDRESPLLAGTEPVVRLGLSDLELPVDSGRWIEVDVDMGGPLTLVSAYFHSGQFGTPKQDAKMAHFPLIEARLAQLQQAAADTGRQSLVAGDFNVVRSERDIKNWRPNHNKSSGVLDEEIVFLDRWIDQGWVDVARELAGDVQGPYTWWSWRGKAFDNDAGWRIDYHYATPELASRAVDARVFRAPSWEARFSDHAPLTVQYRTV